jgi:hypothetical protein
MFQIDPPITYSDSARNIELQDSELPGGTSLFQTGWGYIPVSQCIMYYIEQKLTFWQNASKWTTVVSQRR